MNQQQFVKTTVLAAQNEDKEMLVPWYQDLYKRTGNKAWDEYIAQRQKK
jgi:hypothetical protein